jgi:hypothetical protein
VLQSLGELVTVVSCFIRFVRPGHDGCDDPDNAEMWRLYHTQCRCYDCMFWCGTSGAGDRLRHDARCLAKGRCMDRSQQLKSHASQAAPFSAVVFLLGRWFDLSAARESCLASCMFLSYSRMHGTAPGFFLAALYSACIHNAFLFQLCLCQLAST